MNERFPAGHDQEVAFRASRAAALAFGPSPVISRPSISFEKTRRKRSSVLAVVTKRVEMLHMNVICRECSQVLVSSVALRRVFTGSGGCIGACKNKIERRRKDDANRTSS